MKAKEFERNLLLYGGDVRCWPPEMQSTGLKALRRFPECQKLVEEEVRFEDVLKNRKYEDPGEDLAARISTAISPRSDKKRSGFGAVFMETLQELCLPRSLRAGVWVALLFSLIIGFTIGFSSFSRYASAEPHGAGLEEFLTYEGDVL